MTDFLSRALIAGFVCCALASAETNTPPPNDIVRGKVQSINSNTLKLATRSGVINIRLLKPFTVYESRPASLSDVKSSSFVGVTSVKDSDGSQHATEIHIFPEALRGLGEGSYMMDGQLSASRMTNGQVSKANKPPGGSRMTNGLVASSSYRKLIVEFEGGKQSIDVPTGVPVTEILPVSKKLISGDAVVLQVRRDSAGDLSATMVIVRNAP